MGVETKATMNLLDSIPAVLIREIVARVAAYSSDDLFSTKLSCKILNEIGDDEYVMQRVSLAKFCVVPYDEQENFLERCTNSGNPEAIYRQGIIHYFGYRKNEISGMECLWRAANLGHLEAKYVIGILLILDGGGGDDSEKGMKIIGDLKKLKVTGERIGEIRKNFKTTLRLFMEQNTEAMERPTCCTRHEHEEVLGWEITYEGFDSECEACLCDEEIIFLWDVISKYILDECDMQRAVALAKLCVVP